MIALDEYEAHWWSLRRSAELALFREQQSEIRRRDQCALVHLDDPKAKGLAHSHRFDAARDELIRRYSTTPAAARMQRRASSRQPAAPDVAPRQLYRRRNPYPRDFTLTWAGTGIQYCQSEGEPILPGTGSETCELALDFCLCYFSAQVD